MMSKEERPRTPPPRARIRGICVKGLRGAIIRKSESVGNAFGSLKGHDLQSCSTLPLYTPESTSGPQCLELVVNDKGRRQTMQRDTSCIGGRSWQVAQTRIESDYQIFRPNTRWQPIKHNTHEKSYFLNVPGP
jgi:hypothetical protein